MTKTTINQKFITLNGKRVGVRYSVGPWVPGVPAELIKIRPHTGSAFPAEFRAIFAIENNSDAMTDYFEKDTIRVLPGHPLYEQIKSVAA